MCPKLNSFKIRDTTNNPLKLLGWTFYNLNSVKIEIVTITFIVLLIRK